MTILIDRPIFTVYCRAILKIKFSMHQDLFSHKHTLKHTHTSTFPSPPPTKLGYSCYGNQQSLPLIRVLGPVQEGRRGDFLEK